MSFIKKTYRLEKEIFQAPHITKYAKYFNVMKYITVMLFLVWIKSENFFFA